VTSAQICFSDLTPMQHPQSGKFKHIINKTEWFWSGFLAELGDTDNQIKKDSKTQLDRLAFISYNKANER